MNEYLDLTILNHEFIIQIICIFEFTITMREAENNRKKLGLKVSYICNLTYFTSVEREANKSL